MAKADFKMPEDFLLRLSKLGNQTDTILPKVLDAGGKIVAAKVKSNLRASIGNTKFPSRTTGELIGALGVTSAKLDRNDNHNVKVGFAEPRKGGGSNAKIANVLEHGKHGQPAKPFLKPAKSAARISCINAMKEKLEEETEKI